MSIVNIKNFIKKKKIKIVVIIAISNNLFFLNTLRENVKNEKSFINFCKID